MEFSPTRSASKVEIPMAPMIDIVFQLLIFFMLNLHISAPEGDFNVNLPAGVRPGDGDIPAIKVGLLSDRDGNLTQLTVGQKNLGNDEAPSSD